MAHITETIAFDRRLQLGNEQYIRRMSIGGSWSKLRIGVRFSFNGRSNLPTTGFLGAATGLVIGVGVDATSGYFQDRSGGFFGASLGSGVTGTFYPSQANSSYYDIGTGNSTQIVSRFDATVLTQGWNFGSALQYISASSAQPHEFMVTMTKNNNIYGIADMFAPTNPTSVQAGKTPLAFMSDMDNEIGTGLVNLTRSSNALNYATLTHALFPYLVVGWNHSTPTVEITHIAVTRFY